LDSPPLHAIANGASPNGVYQYGASSFPGSSYNATNYWVDVVFNTGAAPDTTPPTVTSTVPASGAKPVGLSTTVTAAFSEALNASTVTTSTFQLRDALNTLVAANVSYDPASGIATLAPQAALQPDTTYTARLVGGATDPRIKDAAGNALAADYAWSFTTASLPTGFVDTLPADFSRGTLDSGAYIAQTADGALVGTGAQYAAGRSLEFIASFSGAPYQHAGFAVTFAEGLWAMFSSSSGDALYARTNNGSTATNTAIPGSWFGTPHRFTIDWMRMSPYAGTSTYLSAIFDAAAVAAWNSAAWTGSTPAGTSVELAVRSGNSPAPDASWSGFVVVNGPIDVTAQYLQYRLRLTTTAAGQTPAVNDVTLGLKR